MMPVIRVDDATFHSLKTIAEWKGTSTPSKTIEAIVKKTLEDLGLLPNSSATDTFEGHKQKTFVASEPLGFTHTKILNATVDGVKIENPNWRKLLHRTVFALKAKGVEKNELIGLLNVPASVSRSSENGFKYDPEIGIAIQGQSAESAWAEVTRICEKHDICVKVDVKWRDKPGALYPNQERQLTAGSKT